MKGIGKIADKLNKSKLNNNKQTVRKEFEDTKGEIRIIISKKDRQHNGQQKK
jgi:hypothetical protein